MRRLITAVGWKDEDCLILLDRSDSKNQPTQKGKNLFFFFSFIIISFFLFFIIISSFPFFFFSHLLLSQACWQR